MKSTDYSKPIAFHPEVGTSCTQTENYIIHRLITYWLLFLTVPTVRCLIVMRNINANYVNYCCETFHVQRKGMTNQNTCGNIKTLRTISLDQKSEPFLGSQLNTNLWSDSVFLITYSQMGFGLPSSSCHGSTILRRWLLFLRPETAGRGREGEGERWENCSAQYPRPLLDRSGDSNIDNVSHRTEYIHISSLPM